jgi:single-stranded-DNA-specific exonuclease
MGARVDYVVPNRFEYGYGLTPEIVDLAASRAPRPELLITVDNGIASVDGVERANQLGIAVLITDHHLPGDRLPAAAAIVNPNQRGCGFPSKHLAGVGVMFYVLTALRAELRRRGRFTEASQPRLDALLDLVALGTVADVVRLDRNNRILVAAGLHRVQTGRMQPGVAALFQIAGRSTRTAHAGDFGFAVGPRINAAGRLTDMTVGIECLLTDDPQRALELAGQLEKLNRERRAIEADMNLGAMAELDADYSDERRTICLFNASWHPGVVGLVASRVKERFHRPTIAFATLDGNDLRGSGRSIDGVHLRDTLDLVTKAAPQLVDKFGGHAMAAGVTLKHANFQAFVDAFEAATRASADHQLFARTLSTDGALAPKEITFGLVEAIERQIWGQGFPPPLFANEFTVLEQRLVGDQHLKLSLDLAGKRFEAIWFRRTATLPSRARLAYRPIVEEYQGLRRINLLVEAASL